MKSTRFGLTLLLALAAGACGGGDGGGETVLPQPEPGTLTVSLTTPNAGDRALVVQVTGPSITGAQSANTAYVMHSRTPSAGTLRAAVFGPLATGPVLRIQVADVNAVASYSATVVEVADETNALRTITGYTAAVAR